MNSSEKELLSECYPLMGQLRPDLDYQDYLERLENQMACGYELGCLCEAEKPLGLIGFSIADCFSAGKHVYIFDFIVEQTFRSKGLGKLLLEWLLVYARTQGCKRVHLDISLSRGDAARFFLKENFSVSALHYSKSLIDKNN